MIDALNSMLDSLMDSAYIKSLPFLYEGLKLTLLITIVGLFLGFILGAFTGLGRLSKNGFIRGISTIFVEVVRGTPILVQVLFIYFGISEDLIGVNISALTAAIIAITINAGAYIAEIVRGAVHSIDKGQYEAGRAVGLTERQTMRYIIWPQAFKRMIPPLGNQFIISLKDTSLFSVIAVGELVYQGRQYYNATFEVFETLVMVCIIYLMITIPTSVILRRVERKLDV
ncbi:amino acid ABC transporter permease [Alkalibacillus haloalkaliphilus]|uniref:Glutamine ABC transporter permease n=1 Tax=Alkalibacillus haloalkaliphilus TaxID=94136 RepID=A0A511W5I0_9BACI|nr:amino acid ABC transporter permease [Alkalibacillus haloalkaliphilus]MDV2581946.1 amino acid ABC transporter permease [Alkalibacillus haloalkaliphilus]GEN46350.1 glutamine ABC transporter permease [Alkalibacillus haloalkaliphilus]